jgi:hypothetical protein
VQGIRHKLKVNTDLESLNSVEYPVRQGSYEIQKYLMQAKQFADSSGHVWSYTTGMMDSQEFPLNTWIFEHIHYFVL